MGVILVLISSVFFVISTYFGKLVTNTTEMSAVVTSFSRFLLGAIIMFIYILATKKTFKANNIKPVIFRAIFNSLAIIQSSWALKYTTITNNNMLHMTYPVFVIILAPFITKEKNKKSNYIYLLLIMLGTYIVSNPSFSTINIGDMASLFSAVIAAISILSLKEAAKSNESYLIIFYVMLIGTFINIPFAYKDLLNFDISGIIPVFLAALCGFLGQVFLTWGYLYLDSATGSLTSSSRVIIAAIIGAIFLLEPVNLRIVSGILLISGSLIALSGFFNKEKSITKSQLTN